MEINEAVILPEIFNLPAYRDRCESDTEEIERHLDEQDIKGIAQDYPPTTVLDVKEICIKSDILALAQRIAKKYDHLTNPTHQVVEIDWTLIDLFPGDTEIHYKISTKREVCEGEYGNH